MQCGNCQARICCSRKSSSGTGVTAVWSAYCSSSFWPLRMTVSCTICSVSPGAPITRLTMSRSGVESSTERNTITSWRCGVPNAGSRQQWMPVSGISSSPPYTALLTNRKSPTSKVFTMLADGMRNASTKNERNTIQMRSAEPIALARRLPRRAPSWEEALEVWWRVVKVGKVWTDAERSWMLHPISDEDVRLALHFAVAVRGPHELFAVGREHGERIKLRVRRDLLEAAPIGVHEVQIKIPRGGMFVVRREDEF